MNLPTPRSPLAKELVAHYQLLSRVQRSLLSAWLLMMVAIPILRWLLGDEALWWGVNSSVLLLAGAVLAILYSAWGMVRTLSVTVPVLLLAWFLEWIGHSTGYPFGAYTYTSALQPQLGGVPLLIPLAWLMMLPPAWAIGAAISGRHQGGWFIIISAAAFTAWDFFLDPQMVQWGYWQWEMDGGYLGIPWLNFGGWLLGAALITFLVRPPQAPRFPLLLIYLLTWLLQSIGQAMFWAMPGPALIGFLVMGSFAFSATVVQANLDFPNPIKHLL